MAAIAVSSPPVAQEKRLSTDIARTTSFIEANGAIDSIFEVEWAAEAENEEVKETAKKAHEVRFFFFCSDLSKCL